MTTEPLRKFWRKVKDDIVRGPSWGSRLHVAPKEVFIVAWQGGYEDPAYSGQPTLDKAIALGKMWAKDIKSNSGDQVQILSVNLETFVVRTVMAWWIDADGNERWTQ